MLNSSKEENVFKNVGNSDIALEDVTVVAQRATKDSTVKVLNYQFNDYSANKLGFLGSHRSLKVVVQKIDSANSETLNFFVKSVPNDNDYQAAFLRNDEIFTKEKIFFQSITPLMTAEYVDEKWGPECYLLKNEMLIMEDLRYQNYRLDDSLFDETIKIKSILATIARFHSCSILTEARLNRHSKRQITLQECFPEALKEKMYARSSKLNRWTQNSMNLTLILAEKFGLNSQNLHKTLERVYAIAGPSEIHRNVICHGDLWKNNLMFDSTKSTPKCVLVDFQLVKYGPLALEILQVIYMNSSRKYRQKYEKELIEFYHSILEKTIKNNDTTKSVSIPSIEEILYAVEDLRLYGVFLPCLYYPLIYLDPDVVIKHTEDSETYEKFMFGDRKDVTLKQMEKSDNYKNKLKAVVTEFVELSEQLNC